MRSDSDHGRHNGEQLAGLLSLPAEPATTSGGFPDRVDDAAGDVLLLTQTCIGGYGVHRRRPARQWTLFEDVARLVAELPRSRRSTRASRCAGTASTGRWCRTGSAARSARPPTRTEAPIRQVLAERPVTAVGIAMIARPAASFFMIVFSRASCMGKIVSNTEAHHVAQPLASIPLPSARGRTGRRTHPSKAATRCPHSLVSRSRMLGHHLAHRQHHPAQRDQRLAQREPPAPAPHGCAPNRRTAAVLELFELVVHRLDGLEVAVHQARPTNRAPGRLRRGRAAPRPASAAGPGPCRPRHHRRPGR